MKPIKFKEVNRTLQKPESMAHEECQPLPIFTDGKTCISLWQGNLLERLRYLLTGKMWLWVVSGGTQPPVLVDTKRPWK